MLLYEEYEEGSRVDFIRELSLWMVFFDFDMISIRNPMAILIGGKSSDVTFALG